MATRFGGVSGGVGSGTVTQVNSGTGLSGGPITTSGTLNLADTAVTPSTYGDATHVSRITVDQQGRITTASAVAITAGAGTVTQVNTGVGLTGGPITGTGTIDLANVAAVAHKFVSSVAANALVLAQPDVSDLTGTGTGVITALGVNVGSAGAFVTFNGALGTPSSGTLTSATGLPISTGLTGAGTGVLTSLGTANNAAGGYTPIDGTATMTNKRMTFRAPTITQSATPTINTDVTDYAEITGLAQDITSMTTNLSGTPVKGDRLWISITGTATRAITWGTSFEASTVALPTTTVSTARLDIGFTWNVATTKWRCVATA